jgi:heme-degrading monooxygenase HmoA
MMTIVTRVMLREEGVEQWDRAMHARVEAAREKSGWVSAQLLRGIDEPLERAIVGVWETREDWSAWHHDEAFRSTREQLAGLEAGETDSTWFEVVQNTATEDD